MKSQKIKTHYNPNVVSAPISLTLPKSIFPGHIPERDSEISIFPKKTQKHLVFIYTTLIQKLKREL